MPAKVKTFLAGRELQGVLVGYKALEEGWNEYALDDGARIRMKSIVSEIVRTDEKREDGTPVYVLKINNVVVTEASPVGGKEKKTSRKRAADRGKK